MILYRTSDGLILERDGKTYPVPEDFVDDLLVRSDLDEYLLRIGRNSAAEGGLDETKLLPPIGTQEVWAAGVTYFRSRVARMEESEQASSFYDRVYSAQRPELFFKCLPSKVVGPGAAVAIRSDATWSVPEPELVLVINPKGRIVGYTIGNDMSSRDIEGENPLYLPQAKIYNRSCAVGPGILLQNESLPPTTRITLEIERSGQTAFSGATSLSEMKRRPDELVEYLWRDQTFSTGCFLFTGTGVVPPDSFTLKNGDTIRIGIDGIGVLTNPVA